MSRTQHPTIKQAQDKVRETVQFCKQTGSFGISTQNGLFDLAREKFGLGPKNENIPSQLSKGDTIPLGLIQGIALVTGLEVDNPTLISGTHQAFVREINARATGLRFEVTRTIDHHPELASVKIDLVQNRDSTVPVGGEIQILGTLRFSIDEAALDNGSDVALGRCELRITPTAGEVTDRLEELTRDTTGMADKLTLLTGGEAAPFWRFTMPADEILLGKLETIFCKIAGIRDGTEIRAALSTVIKDFQNAAPPPTDHIRSAEGEALQHPDREKVLARLKAKQMPIAEDGRVILGEHSITFSGGPGERVS